MDSMPVLVLLLVALWFGSAVGDKTTRIAFWRQPRAAVVRDTLYLDGGEMGTYLWDTSTKNWATDDTIQVGDTGLKNSGIVYILNFNKTFSVQDDFFTLFDNLTSGPVTNNPPFRSGFMFADDYEFYTFGGISLQAMGKDAALLNDLIWKPNGSIPSVIPNFQTGLGNTYAIPSDSSGVSRYITHGGGVNIPSEYLGFYFSGLQSTTGGYLENYNPDADPSVIADQMIQVNMTMMGSAEWAMIPLESSSAGATTAAQARPGTQLVWIPVGPQGILVVLGGVSSPSDAFANQTATTSPGDALFMTELSVYDINSGQWYAQPTSGGSPSQVADFCTVVAHEPGTDSFQIYAYGGYNGDVHAEPYNSVWVLSIPSFHWTDVTPSVSDAGRHGHLCFTPYPNQMLVVGGEGGQQTGPQLPLPGGKLVQVLNLNTLEWQDTYDPNTWDNYTIPAILRNQGDPNQKAVGMDTGLSALFDEPYPTPLTTWYPYKSNSSGGTHWLVPVLGGVLGGVAVAVLGFLIWLFRRRRNRKSGRGSSSQPEMSETQVSTADDGVDHWRRRVKSMASSAAMEIDSSDRSTVNNEPQQEAVEIGGRTHFYSPRSPRSPGLSATDMLPQSPQSVSVEVSGDPLFRQEMQDTSPRQRPRDHDPSGAQQPDYRFRNHPMFPLNVSDSMSVSEPGLTSAKSQIPSAGSDFGPSTIMSYQAAPLLTNDYQQLLYGGPPPVPPKQRVISTPERADLRHVPSIGRMPHEDIYPGDALPSPITREMPTNPHTASSGFRTFQVMPDGGIQTPLVQSTAATDRKHPGIHERNLSDQSTASIQIPSPGHPLPPSPTPAEEHRRSALIDEMPEHPSLQSPEPSATWPQQQHTAWRTSPETHIRVAPPANTAAVRRKEIGSPVRSAYAENQSRFREH